MRTAFACSTLAVALALAACSQPSAAPAVDTAATASQRAGDQSARLNAWFDEQYEQALQFSPLRMTFLGRKDLYDQLDDVSPEAQRRQLAWMQASVEAMPKPGCPGICGSASTRTRATPNASSTTVTPSTR